MTAQTLRETLGKSTDRDGMVDAVSEYFSAHELFYGHGTDNPADEAFWLVWHLSGAPDSLAGLPVTAELTDAVVDLAEARVLQRRPLAQLLGTAWFAGLEFDVSDKVLVPRSPLAELIEAGFEPWTAPDPGDRVLEIGTGSGCIAIATAVLMPELAVDATEIDSAALRLARRNIERHRVGDRVRLFESDLWPAGETGYRVIISNPPYVPTADIGSLPEEYGHEPALALDGGADGLDIVRRILDGAAARLTADGILVVEVGQSADALADAFPRMPWTWLEFERGGDGVFLLTADELKDGWG